MVDLVGSLMSEWNKLDVKTSRNLCDMIWYVFEQLNVIAKEKREPVLKSMFGHTFPYYEMSYRNNENISNNNNARVLYDARVISLK
jgi:hypothetical protein